LALTSAVTTAIDCNGGKATVTIVATGGTAPYSYTFQQYYQYNGSFFTDVSAGTGLSYSFTDAKVVDQ
jgi:hypothetical protein